MQKIALTLLFFIISGCVKKQIIDSHAEFKYAGADELQFKNMKMWP